MQKDDTRPPLGLPITPDECVKLCQDAIAKARKTFHVPEAWRLTVVMKSPPEGQAAEIEMMYPYRSADIRIDLDYLCRYPQDIEPVMAHEVAHTVSAGLWEAFQRLGGKAADVASYEHKTFRDEIETMTMQLQSIYEERHGIPPTTTDPLQRVWDAKS